VAGVEILKVTDAPSAEAWSGSQECAHDHNLLIENAIAPYGHVGSAPGEAILHGHQRVDGPA